MFHRLIPRVFKSIGHLNNVRPFCAQMDGAKFEKTMNQVTLLGRVGADPQKRGNLEHPVIMFSVATHTNYRYEDNTYMQKTEWHKICVFKPKLRDTVFNYLKKGQRILVNGRLSYGEFKDEQGNMKPSSAIVADDVIFLHSP